MKKKLTSAAIIAICLWGAGCNNPEGGVEKDSLADATEDTAVVYQDEKGRIAAEGAEVKQLDERFWKNIDFDAPVVAKPRVQDAGVEEREGEGYRAYTLDEKILFDLDKATLRAGAADKLNNVVASIKEYGDQGEIRIYGHTDSIASKDYNIKLSEERANAVKNWLQNNSDLDASRMSVHPMGQGEPRATNETAAGRQKNRRVAIVVATN